MHRSGEWHPETLRLWCESYKDFLTRLQTCHISWSRRQNVSTFSFAALCLFCEGQRLQLDLTSGHCFLHVKHSGHRPRVNHQSLCVVFRKQVRGFKQIGGRSKSILSSVFLSLRALICCCQWPLTDVLAQRSGPGSHAASTPPDTQPVQ